MLLYGPIGPRAATVHPDSFSCGQVLAIQEGVANCQKMTIIWLLAVWWAQQFRRGFLWIADSCSQLYACHNWPTIYTALPLTLCILIVMWKNQKVSACDVGEPESSILQHGIFRSFNPAMWQNQKFLCIELNPIYVSACRGSLRTIRCLIWKVMGLLPLGFALTRRGSVAVAGLEGLLLLEARTIKQSQNKQQKSL